MSGPLLAAPPQHPIRWTHTPEEVLQLTKDAIQRDREVSRQWVHMINANYSSLQTNDKIATLPKDARNLTSVCPYMTCR